MQLIKRWAIAVFIITFLVVIAGGVVRTTQSGMGCPDWPKCFGKWIPPTNANELPLDFEKYLRKQDIDHTFNAYHTWIEYFNRLLGALLGLVAVVQFVLLFFKRKTNKKSYRFAIAFLGLVLLTGLFGAIVVKYNLAHVSISIHLLFAVVMILVQLTLILSLNQKLKSQVVSKNQMQLLIGFTGLLIIQFVLGTLVRMYIDDVSKTLHYNQRETWLVNAPIAFIIHRSFSWLLLLAAFFTSFKFSKTLVAKRVFMLTGFVLLNAIIGIVLYYANMPAFAQPIHLLVATIAIIQAVNILFVTKVNTQ